MYAVVTPLVVVAAEYRGAIDTMTSINRKLILKSRPQDDVQAEHFELCEEQIPDLSPGEFLVRNQYLSFEPAQRGWLNDLPSYIPPVQIGEVMRAMAVGDVVASRHEDFAVGDQVLGAFGWQDYAVADGKDSVFPVTKIDPEVPITYPLHIYGLTVSPA